MRRAVLILVCGLAVTAAWGQPPPPDDYPRHKGPPRFMKGPGDPLLERLSRMTPEERARLLESLPPERRKRVEERLAWYNQLTPEERSRMQNRFWAFRDLPPEKQEAMRQTFRKLNELPDERRFMVRRAARHLRFLPPEERSARMSSEEFRNRFSPAEQQLVAELVKIMPPPPPRGMFGPWQKKK